MVASQHRQELEYRKKNRKELEGRKWQKEMNLSKKNEELDTLVRKYNSTVLAAEREDLRLIHGEDPNEKFAILRASLMDKRGELRAQAEGKEKVEAETTVETREIFMSHVKDGE